MSIENYQQSFAKNAKSTSIQVKPKQMTSKEMSEERRKKLIDWITFYRRNLHRFVEHYMGIKLYFYQRIWIYLMGTRDSFVAIASRASAKSWLVGILAVARAILYPSSQVVIVSSTKEQAGVIIEEKIKPLLDDYPNIAREISSITTNLNRWQVEFYNGSVIKVVASRDSSRGKRSTFTIFEEFRVIDKSILDSVVRPFAFIRQPPYLKDKKYSKYIEEPKEIFISSAYLRGLWWLDETRKTIVNLLKGKNVGFMAFDVRLAIHHQIKSLSQIVREIDKMDELTALMEYFNLTVGESSQSYFKLKHFNALRKIDSAFYPQRKDDYGTKKKNPYAIKRVEGEVRILSCDLAQRAGKNNDLSINGCIRLIPTSKGYYRELLFMESFSGENSIKQALRIKQVFHDFECDVIVLDVGAGGGGIPIYDELGQVTKDPERNLEYPPYTIMPHESIDNDTYNELSKRTLGLNAVPNIYCFSATSKLNSLIAVSMKDMLKKKMFGFLVDETRAEDFLIKNRYKEYMRHDDIEAKAFFMSPYVQTSLLINEAINLVGTWTTGNLKLTEPAGARKDRIVMLMMANYYASFLDAGIMKDDDKSSDEDAILAVTLMG